MENLADDLALIAQQDHGFVWVVPTTQGCDSGAMTTADFGQLIGRTIVVAGGMRGEWASRLVSPSRWWILRTGSEAEDGSHRGCSWGLSRPSVPGRGQGEAEMLGVTLTPEFSPPGWKPPPLSPPAPWTPFTRGRGCSRWQTSREAAEAAGGLPEEAVAAGRPLRGRPGDDCFKPTRTVPDSGVELVEDRVVLRDRTAGRTGRLACSLLAANPTEVAVAALEARIRAPHDAALGLEPLPDALGRARGRGTLRHTLEPGHLPAPVLMGRL